MFAETRALQRSVPRVHTAKHFDQLGFGAPGIVEFAFHGGGKYCTGGSRPAKLGVTPRSALRVNCGAFLFRRIASP
jgi:hypothetical protein